MRVTNVPPRAKVHMGMNMPWEQPEAPPEIDVVETVRALQADLRFMLVHTSILVRSNNEALCMVFNTQRGQLMPNPLRCTFQGGTTMEFQDLGMPLPGMPTKTIKEIVTTALEKAFVLGLQP